MCERKPKLKRTLGCDAPPVSGGVETTWDFPPHDPTVKLDRCPLRVLTTDVYDLFRSLSLSDGKVSLLEQQALPPPYVEALSLASSEQAARRTHEVKRD